MHFYWVILDLQQKSKQGAGNVSLPRMLPSHNDEDCRPVEFCARYYSDVGSITKEPLLALFSEPENAFDHMGELLAEGRTWP